MLSGPLAATPVRLSAGCAPQHHRRHLYLHALSQPAYRHGTMQALTPDPVTNPRSGLPALSTHPSWRSTSNHVAGPIIALTAKPAWSVSSRLHHGLASSSPYPAESSSSPADRQFASGCSPPRLTATQLPSATGPWHTPARTSTKLS